MVIYIPFYMHIDFEGKPELSYAFAMIRTRIQID